MPMYRRRRRGVRRTVTRGYRRRATSTYRRRTTRVRRRAPRRTSRAKTIRLVVQVAGPGAGVAAASPTSLGMKTRRIVRARY